MAQKNTTIFLIAALAVGILLLSNSSASADDSTDALATDANMVSQAQLAQTAQFEGFSAKAYRDGGTSSNPLYSIGYGHQIQPGEQYLMTATISQGQAQQMLLNDMQTVVDSINNSGVQFTQGQFDASADYGYNAGVGALQTLINLFNSSGAEAVADWLPTSRVTSSGMYVPGLTTRRKAEAATWQAGTPLATDSGNETASTTYTGGTDDSGYTDYFNTGLPDSLTQ